ncbi:MAG: sodium:alanine symporter family protein [Nitrospirota bacterium]|jgi:AGCS family alanine or glycine:cation symporter
MTLLRSRIYPAVLLLCVTALYRPTVAAAAEPPTTVIERIDSAFSGVVAAMSAVLFWEPVAATVTEADGTPTRDAATGEPRRNGIPLIVLVLVAGATFFTAYMRFINVRAFRHAIAVIRGHYDRPEDKGQITHAQALTAALSATVGLGNIAGVAVAVGTGGPGAVLWMILIASLGMTSKFVECTLAQLYRRIEPDGTVYGGPMYYLEIGLKERGLAPLGKVLGVAFAVLCIGGSFGGGNMFQANQSFRAVAGQLPAALADHPSLPWLFGLALAFLVGLVIVGGIRRIGEVTVRLIPSMALLYCLTCVSILLRHLHALPDAVHQIFAHAFSLEAGLGGLVGVAVMGIRRAVFSNEAGIGSAAIAHSAARTDEPVREGVVAMIGPFIDTIVICFMTAMVVIVTGAWNDPAAGEGVQMTSYAFATVFPWFPNVLAACVFLFAYSTLISWSYYGEKATAYLFGHTYRVALTYRLVFLACIVLGTVSSLSNVLDFSDMMILSMAFPNILGAVILAPKVRSMTADYWHRHRTGQMPVYR